MKTIKNIMLLIAVLLFSGCGDSGKPIEIALEQTPGYGLFRSSRSIVSPARHVVEYRGVPEGIVEYVVREFSLQPAQHAWERYLDGHLSQDALHAQMERLGADTTLLSREPLQHRVRVLVGTHENGKRVIIADANNDGDFSNDPLFEYDYPLEVAAQLELEAELPAVDVQVQLFVDGEVVTQRVNMVFSPYEGNVRITYSNISEKEQKYYLFASTPHHRQGSVRLRGQPYSVHVANDFAGPLYDHENARLLIVADTADAALPDAAFAWSPGEVVHVDGYDYLFAGVSPFGERLLLEPLGENPQPFGITEGFRPPAFKALTLDREVFRLEDHAGSYVLLDFWGTWCMPCIRLIPELKQLHADLAHHNFRLVGVAFDRDAAAVQEFVHDNEMNWLHTFVEMSRQEPLSLVEVFKVNAFPTKILIDPEGKIIARGKSIEEIRELLGDAFPEG
jgi:thiol-disulfide isomerase/thioredoxin